MRRPAIIGPVAPPLLAGCATPGGEAVREVLDDAASPVRAMGFSDSDDGSAFNFALSATWGEQVASGPCGRGVPGMHISVVPRGPLPSEMMHLESHRLEIVPGGQAAAR